MFDKNWIRDYDDDYYYLIYHQCFHKSISDLGINRNSSNLDLETLCLSCFGMRVYLSYLQTNYCVDLKMAKSLQTIWLDRTWFSIWAIRLFFCKQFMTIGLEIWAGLCVYFVRMYVILIKIYLIVIFVLPKAVKCWLTFF